MKRYLAFSVRSLQVSLWMLALVIHCPLWGDNLENPPVSSCSGEWTLLQWLSADYKTDQYVVRGADGTVSEWKDRSSKAKHMEQLDALKRPSFVHRTTHPSGLGTVVFNGGKVLTGPPVVTDTMEDIAIIIVWRPDSLQSAVLWQQGSLSIVLRDNGTYGLVIDGVLNPEVHSYREHEHLVSILWIDRSGIDGAATAHFYHNARTTASPLDLGAITISSTASTGLGGNATEGYFSGQIQELLVYNNCLNLSQVQYFTNLFRDAYNLGLDTTGDGFPNSPMHGDANWDGIPNWWYAWKGLNPWDPDIANRLSDDGSLTWRQRYDSETHEFEAHWPLTDGSGSIALDHSAWGNHGHLSGLGVLWRPDGYGVELDGQGEVTINIDVKESLDFGESSMTMSLWFSTTEQGSKFLMSKGHSPGYSLMLAGGDAGGRIMATLGGGSGTLQMRTVDHFNDGKWHHAVAVFDRNERKGWLYIDRVRQQITAPSSGVVVDGDTLDFSSATGQTASSDRNFYIGAFDNGSGPVARFNGALADARVYQSAFSKDSIDRLFSADGTPDWWHYHHFGHRTFGASDPSPGDSSISLLQAYLEGRDPNAPTETGSLADEEVGLEVFLPL